MYIKGHIFLFTRTLQNSLGIWILFNFLHFYLECFCHVKLALTWTKPTNTTTLASWFLLTRFVNTPFIFFHYPFPSYIISEFVKEKGSSYIYASRHIWANLWVMMVQKKLKYRLQYQITILIKLASFLETLDLHLYFVQGQAAVVDYLLEAGADPNQKVKTFTLKQRNFGVSFRPCFKVAKQILQIWPSLRCNG